MPITKDRFIKIVREEGIPEECIESLWNSRPQHLPIEEVGVRIACRLTLQVISRRDGTALPKQCPNDVNLN